MIPKNRWLFFGLAWIVLGAALLMSCGRDQGKQSRIAELETRLQADPNQPELQYELAELYYDINTKEANEKAIEHYKKVLELAPDHAKAQAGLACAYAMKYFNYSNESRGWATRAHEAALKAVELDPELPEGYRALGMALSALGKNLDAIEMYKRAIRLNASDARTYNNLGLAYFSLGQYGNAIESYQKAVTLDPEEAAYRNNLGLAYLNNNQVDEAIRAYEQAIKRDKKLAVAYTGLAMAYERQGDTKRSREAMREAARLEQLNQR